MILPLTTPGGLPSKPPRNKLVCVFARLHLSTFALLAVFAALGVAALVPFAAQMLRRNILIYGVGGIIAPFPGIWVIDRLLGLLHLA